MGTIEWVLVGIIVLGLIAPALQAKSRKRNKTTTQKRKNPAKTTSRRTTLECRSDDIILISHLDDLSGPEFERLLALYFRDQGYTVKEVGVGGSDGGVDLVIIDKRDEKTAVQAKCCADGNNVKVQTVR